jgi:signal transduction histidine kinase
MINLRPAKLVAEPYRVEPRQSLLCAAFFVSLAMLLIPSVRATSVPAVITGTAVMAVATIVALVVNWEQFSRFSALVPLMSLVAIGFLRTGTGGGTSMFASLLILAAISLGAEPHRRAVLYGIPVILLVTLLPAVFDRAAALADGQWLRLIYLPIVLSVTAWVVHEWTSRLRARLEVVDEMRRREQGLVQEARQQSEVALAASARLARSEAQLRRSESQLRSVIAAVTEQSIIGTDLTGRIDVFNTGAERLLGYTAEEMIGKAFITDVHARDELVGFPGARRPSGPIEPARPSDLAGLVPDDWDGSPVVREWTKLRRDGNPIPTQVAITARSGPDGEITGLLFVATDLTAARARAALQDQFITLISHELRTPLSSILGYLELIEDDPDQPLSDEQRRHLATVERNAHRLLRLVSDLLFTAQVQSGQFSLITTELELAPIVAATRDSLTPAAAAQSITLETSVPDGLVVSADGGRLGQALDNLVGNALKFTPAGGTVTVTTRQDDEWITVDVRDTGIGIPADELKWLFGQFFRASTATRAAVPGVGLGLSITRAIATAHGGDIDVQSTPGVGTTFSLRLPALQPSAPGAPPEAAVAVSAAGSPAPSLS